MAISLSKLLIIIIIIFSSVFTSCDNNIVNNSKIDCDILAKSNSLEDVQSAINLSENGDVIGIPSGKVIWTESLNIPDDKNITLKGSGKETTIISTSETSPLILISLNRSSSRVTNIGFYLSNDNGVGIDVRGVGWRIDNCEFNNGITSTIEGVNVRGLSNIGGSPIGVIDHCEFNNIRILVTGDANLMANDIWNEPLDLGKNNATFVENCTFTFTKFGNAIDANYGGRYVFRHNLLNDTYIEAHSVQGNNRASRSWEIYNNTLNKVNQGMWAPFFLRGGTGIVFNNTINGYWSSGPAVVVDNRRSFEILGDGGLCDGTSLWDGNEEENGYPARDQIGRSTDDWLWTESNPYPSQKLDPMYQWNNTHEGLSINVYVHNGCEIHIKENRDYYNNIEKPDYIPFDFPHPLIASWDLN